MISFYDTLERKGWGFGPIVWLLLPIITTSTNLKRFLHFKKFSDSVTDFYIFANSYNPPR